MKLVTKKLIFNIHNKFGVRVAVRKRPVLHVTLFGPFDTKSVKERHHSGVVKLKFSVDVY
jgi:hypothetical protein